MISPDSQTPPTTTPADAAHPWMGQQPQVDEHGHHFFSDTKPDPDPTDPRDLKVLNIIDPTKHKRNCGRTGPTSVIGLSISSRNATRHGMCSKTLILENESAEDWHELLTAWLDLYKNPPEKTILYTFVVKTAQAEWFRLRMQREYDLFFASMDSVPVDSWQAEKLKTNDLMQRYVNGAERRVLREKRALDQHWKLHGNPATPAPPAPAVESKPAETVVPKVLFVNSDTGEMEDAHGNSFPPPPGYQPERNSKKKGDTPG